LVFDEADLELQAENILITDGGLLQVCTPAEGSCGRVVIAPTSVYPVVKRYPPSHFGKRKTVKKRSGTHLLYSFTGMRWLPQPLSDMAIGYAK